MHAFAYGNEYVAKLLITAGANVHATAGYTRGEIKGCWEPTLGVGPIFLFSFRLVFVWLPAPSLNGDVGASCRVIVQSSSKSLPKCPAGLSIHDPYVGVVPVAGPFSSPGFHVYTSY